MPNPFILFILAIFGIPGDFDKSYFKRLYTGFWPIFDIIVKQTQVVDFRISLKRRTKRRNFGSLFLKLTVY